MVAFEDRDFQDLKKANIALDKAQSFVTEMKEGGYYWTENKATFNHKMRLCDVYKDNSNWKFNNIKEAVCKILGQRSTIKDALDFLRQYIEHERLTDLSQRLEHLVNNHDFQRLMSAMSNPVHKDKTTIPELLTAYEEAKKVQATELEKTQAKALERTNQIRDLANQIPSPHIPTSIAFLSQYLKDLQDSELFSSHARTIAGECCISRDLQDKLSDASLKITCGELLHAVQQLQQEQGVSTSAAM